MKMVSQSITIFFAIFTLGMKEQFIIKKKYQKLFVQWE